MSVKVTDKTAPVLGAEKWSDIKREIERVGFSYHFEAQYELNQLNGHRIQVRDVDHIAPKESVGRFAVQMTSTEFPPIVITKDDFVVDGNTRVEAKKIRKDGFHTAFVLGVAAEGATEHESRLLTILGSTLNSKAGVNLTINERRKAIGSMLQEGWKSEQIARALGIANSVISAVRKEVEAKEKLAVVGLEFSGASSSLLRALGGANALALNNDPYRKLAQLAANAGLKMSEIEEFASQMRKLGSDSAALAFILAQCTNMEERIREYTLTGNGKPPLTMQLRQRLTFIGNYLGREDVLVEHDVNNALSYLEAIDKAITVLTQVKSLHAQ